MTQRGSVAGRALRGLSGAMTAGLVILTVGLLAVQLMAAQQGNPGPGLMMVFSHLGVSVVSVVLQRAADRRRDASRWWAPLVILIAALALLWFLWWN